MNQIIDWLAGMEKLARDLYAEAAVVFRDDVELFGLLNRLAEDESQHYELMGRAGDYITKNGIDLRSAITLDQNARDRIERPLMDARRLVETRAISKSQMLDLTVQIELSEWNDVFLYVMNALQIYDASFQQMAATIQSHLERIERFISQLPDELKPRADIRKLPRIWHNRFLVVDDDTPVLHLLDSLLSRMGEVQTAENGKEALEKTAGGFFDAIVSDINMPVMDGLEFYRKAIEANPDLAVRFLFCTSEISSATRAFLEERHCPYLLKPFPLDDITQAVQKIARDAP